MAPGANGKIYAIGGRDGPSEFATVEEYDSATNTWMTQASMPTARYVLGVAAANGKIYAIGGYNGIQLATVEEVTLPIEIEPNDSFDQAAVISPGGDVQGAITSTLDVDYCTFRVGGAPASISLSLTNLPANYDLHLYGPGASEAAFVGWTIRADTNSVDITVVIQVENARG